MSNRKVHFSVPIHQIKYLDKQWDAASRLARDGSDWLLMGLDRRRFRDRIERTAEELNRILDQEFRQKIYQERFENFCINEDNVQTTSRATDKRLQNSLTDIDTPLNTSKASCQLTSAESQSSQYDTQQQQQSSKRRSFINTAYTSRKRGRQKRRKRKGGGGRNCRRKNKGRH